MTNLLGLLGLLGFTEAIDVKQKFKAVFYLFFEQGDYKIEFLARRQGIR